MTEPSSNFVDLSFTFRVDIDILELIDILKDKDTPSIKDGEWTTYKVYEYYIGIQKFKRKPRK